jgi:hypothetical protein
MNVITKLILATIAMLSACGVAVVVDKPVADATVAPASPGPAYVWVNDSWDWDRNAGVYVMVPGHWTEPKRKQAKWVDGRWVRVHGGWTYAKGHWKYDY